MSTTIGGNRSRLTRSIVLGVVTVGVLAAIAIGGNHLWQKHSGPTQASAADCALAQSIVDQAQKLPKGEAAVDKWRKDMHDLRIGTDMDGFLGIEVSVYERWAAEKATGKGKPPTAAEFRTMETEANRHCDKKVVFPPISS
jgi:hypothetical protein